MRLVMEKKDEKEARRQMLKAFARDGHTRMTKEVEDQFLHGYLTGLGWRHCFGDYSSYYWKEV